VWADGPNAGAYAYTTYEPPKANPLVMPSIGYRFDHEWGVRTFVIPALKGKSDAWCISIAVERYF
jgi:hypothetical protein